MLILVAVGVDIVTDGGLIGTAEETVQNHNDRVEAEQSKVDEYTQKLEDALK